MSVSLLKNAFWLRDNRVWYGSGRRGWLSWLMGLTTGLAWNAPQLYALLVMLYVLWGSLAGVFRHLCGEPGRGGTTA